MSHKKPKSLITPHERKEPKLSAFPVDDRNGFEFKAEQMDKKGQWGWDNFESKDTREVFQRIFELQKLTWQELVKTGSHPISIQDIIPAAQKRLIEIEIFFGCYGGTPIMKFVPVIKNTPNFCITLVSLHFNYQQ